MRIYIDQLNISALKDIKKEFKDLYIHSEKYILMYSTEGIYKVTNKDTKRFTIIDKDIEVYKNYYDIFTLIKDPSIITLEDCSQIQPTDIVKYIQRNIYKNKTAQQQTKQTNEINDISFIIEEHLISGEMNLYDIYFEISDKINITHEKIKDVLYNERELNINN